MDIFLTLSQSNVGFLSFLSHNTEDFILYFFLKNCVVQTGQQF